MGSRATKSSAYPNSRHKRWNINWLQLFIYRMKKTNWQSTCCHKHLFNNIKLKSVMWIKLHLISFIWASMLLQLTGLLINWPSNPINCFLNHCMNGLQWGSQKTTLHSIYFFLHQIYTSHWTLRTALLLSSLAPGPGRSLASSLCV